MSKFRQAERPGGKFGSVDSGLEFPPKDLDRSRRFGADPDLLAVDILDRDQGHHWRAHGIPCRAFEGLAYADEAPVVMTLLRLLRLSRAEIFPLLQSLHMFDEGIGCFFQ